MSQILEKVSRIEKKGKSEIAVLADTNVILQMGQEIQAFNAMGFKIAVTKSILRELKNKDQALYIHACENFLVINDSTEEIASEARFVYTHAPDNSIIATAKVKNLPLITYDRVMLKVAAYQDVDVCLPEELVRESVRAMEVFE